VIWDEMLPLSFQLPAIRAMKPAVFFGILLASASPLLLLLGLRGLSLGGGALSSNLRLLNASAIRAHRAGFVTA